MPRSDVTFFDDETATTADRNDRWHPAATPEGDQLDEARLAEHGQALGEDTMADHLAKLPTG